MKHISLIRITACLVFALGLTANAAEKVQKPDPSGTWKWSYTGQNGQARETTLVLKLDGDKLTGTISGRSGNSSPIANAALKGDDISFDVTRDVGGATVTQKYNGKISGDTIKGKIESQRNGQPQTRDWEAKREAAKSSDAAKPAAPPAK